MTAPKTPSARGQQRVAVVHDWLTGMRGGEMVLHEILEIFPEAPIYTLFHFPGTVSSLIESHPIHTSFLQRAPLIEERYRHYLPLFPRAIESFDLSRYDLVLSTSHCVAKGARTAPAARHLSYCHTPMRYAWDQRKIYFSQRGPVAMLRNLVLARLRRWDVRTSSRVDTFVANSTFVRDRIQRYYGRQATVIPPPVDTDYFTPASEPHAGGTAYALMVAAFSPYKRLDLAIEACERIGLELRIVGDGPQKTRYERQARESLRLLGRVEPSDLRRLYRRASLYLQPGIEDFGIASTEALACGCPVVALAQGGVLDIVENGVHGVLYAGSEDVSNLSRALEQSLQMEFDKIILRQRSEMFSGSRFIPRLQELLQQDSRSEERSID